MTCKGVNNKELVNYYLNLGLGLLKNDNKDNKAKEIANLVKKIENKLFK